MTKPTKWHVRRAKTQTILGIRPVWSESSLCAIWVAKDQAFFMRSVKTAQTGRMPRLIWVFAGRSHFVGFVMRRLIFFIIWVLFVFFLFFFFSLLFSPLIYYRKLLNYDEVSTFMSLPQLCYSRQPDHETSPLYRKKKRKKKTVQKLRTRKKDQS